MFGCGFAVLGPIFNVFVGGSPSISMPGRTPVLATRRLEEAVASVVPNCII